MALRFIESFEHSGITGGKWTGAGGGGISYTTGRFGGSAVQTNNRYIYKYLPASYAELIFGAAISFNSDGGRCFSWLMSGGTQVYLVYASGTQKISAYRGNGTLLGTGSTLITLSAWHFVEIRTKFDNSTGEVEILSDGVQHLLVTGVDTDNGLGSSGDGIQIGDGNGMFNFFDDIYLLDTASGSPCDDFLGDVRVEALFPTGNGNSSQFLGSDSNSTDNYLLVDDPTPDGDTTYVESSSVGDEDTYAYGNLTSTTGTVYGVAPIPYSRKTDSGPRSICSVARLSATEEDSADTALTASYQYSQDIRQTKPGGGAWTISDVNSAEFGVKVTV